jgi:DNA-binding NtrC family response regulator
VIAIRVPPLRDRPDEIPVLADYFLRRFNTEYGHSVAMSAATLRTFTDYAWPGNVRELENSVRRMMVLESAREATHDVECVVIRATLERVNWNRRKAARLLQMSYRTLLDKIGAYGLAGLPSGNAEPFVA